MNTNNLTTKHTPGPWNFEQVEGDYVHVITNEDGVLAEAFSETVGHIQAVANARLMCAAPMLLEALTLAKATIERLQRHAPNTAKGTIDVIELAISTAVQS